MSGLTKTAFLPRLIGLCLAFVFAIASSPVEASIRQAGAFRPFQRQDNEFDAAYVMQPGSHQVLYEYHANTIVPAASLTKLVGGMTFANAYSSYDNMVKLTSQDEVGGGRLRVPVGSKLSVKDIVYSSITASANNTAVAMSRLGAKSRTVFVQRMNALAKNIGATSSTFVESSGIDVRNKTTAHDMAYLFEQAMTYPILRRAATTASYQFYVRTPSGSILKTIHNTNALIADEELWVTGGKTGYLPESGYHLATKLQPVTAAGTPDRGLELVIIVLGAKTKQGSFDAAKRLAQWAWNNHEFTKTAAIAARTK